MRSTTCRAAVRRPWAVLSALLALLAAVTVGAVIAAPSAGASVCQTCEDPPPPPPPGHPPVRFDIWYPSGAFNTNLAVLKTEDFTGNDEAYLTINGTTVWGPVSVHFQGPSSGPGNGFYNVPFSAGIYGWYVDIAMYDEDWPDPDDNLGSFHFQFPNLAVGQTVYGYSLRFDADSADYMLSFNVTRVS
jgi:hypothetical protein